MNLKHLPLVLVNLAVLCPNLVAQHLWWNLEGQRDATCLYGEITDTRYYVYDREKQQWIHSATIQNPNGGKASVTTIGGGLNSFLENFLGRDKAVVKLATYRLWLGKSVEQMHCLTKAKGDGIWGQLHDAYFLAEGDRTELDRFFAGLAPEYGTPVYGGGGKSLGPISNAAIPPTVIASLQNLPHAGKAAVSRKTAGGSPVKVFILAGQSNMEGAGQFRDGRLPSRPGEDCQPARDQGHARSCAHRPLLVRQIG
jgi:hypothetical protein